MIKRLSNAAPETAAQIHELFQLSYAVEATILGVEDFPPLRRSCHSYANSTNAFIGYYQDQALAGIIEIEQSEELIDINSLVVHPSHFRQGVAQSLIQHVFNQYGDISYVVETGVLNLPAIKLYEKLGFIEVKQWETDFGIRKILFQRQPSSQS